jgi:large subunit ribosomal protein L25
MLTLNVTKRGLDIKLPELRKNGSIPAVFYGAKETSTPVAVSLIDFKKIWKEAGESSVVTLKGDGIELDALIQEVDLHPVTGVPRHADFYVLEKGKKVQVGVPLEFDGVSPAVKDLAGTLVKVLHELEIEALPKDLPHNLTVNIALLTALDSQILAKDISLPSGVELITKPDDVVAAISVAVEEPVDAPAMSIEDIEVEKKGKDEEAVEGAGEAPTKEAEEKK